MDINNHWYRSSHTLLTLALLPLSWSFRGIVSLRRIFYRLNIKKQQQFPVPVIVVGNITVGGTGKTPFVIWLAAMLKEQGFRPGIVSRGYGGAQRREPQWVNAHSDVKQVGDEAVLLARRTQCPLVVSVDRGSAVKHLLSQTDCNIVISDDGLQHYRMGRQIEIVIVDGERGIGNGALLPAGPLREPVSRLGEVDFVVVQGHSAFHFEQAVTMTLQGDILHSVYNPQQTMTLNDLKNKTVHAIAAIGNPQRFFSRLQTAGMTVLEQAFPDHYLFQQQDLQFADHLPVVMTEKDAVKYQSFADERHWYLPVAAQLDSNFAEKLMEKLSPEVLCVT